MTYLLYTAAAQSLVQLLHDSVDGELMIQFVQTFLLESNATAVRWQVHELLYNMHKYVYVLSVLHCFKSFFSHREGSHTLLHSSYYKRYNGSPSKIESVIHNFSSRPFHTLLITLKSLHFFVFGAAVRFFCL